MFCLFIFVFFFLLVSGSYNVKTKSHNISEVTSIQQLLRYLDNLKNVSDLLYMFMFLTRVLDQTRNYQINNVNKNMNHLT